MNLRSQLLTVGLVLAGLLAPGVPARAQGPYPFTAKVGNVSPQLWIPPGVTKLKGVMVFADWLLAPSWAGSADFRAVATRLEVGVILLKGGDLFEPYPGRCASGEYDNLPKALVELGKTAMHPELANAPIIGVGHSHGGDYWNWFNACHPERVAMIFCKSCGGVQYSGAALRTPVLQEIGMNDLNETGSGKPRAGMFINRSKGATMALVLGPGEAHQDFGAAPRQMVLDLLEGMAKLRLAVEGDAATGPVRLPLIDEAAGPYWLGDNYSKAIAPFAMFMGSKPLSSFLPTAALADKWKMTGGMLPAAIKLPSDDCGWCGHPKDEPPLPTDPQPADAGISPPPADAGTPPPEQDAATTPPAPDAAPVMPVTTDAAVAADAGAVTPPVKRDAATTTPPKQDPQQDPPADETPPQSAGSSSGCSFAPARHTNATAVFTVVVLLWLAMLFNKRRRVRSVTVAMLATLGVLAATAPAGATDNGLADKPLMGWSSWSNFKKSINETVIKSQADAMAAELKQFGYTYINLDAGWRDSTRWDAFGYETWDTNKFPNGIPALAAYVHSKGLKLGIYLHPGMDKGPNSPYELNTPIVGTSLHARDITDATQNGNTNASAFRIDFTKPGAVEYIQGYANLMASWGIDFIKFDFVGPGGGTTTADNREEMRQWAAALKRTPAGSAPIWIELSNSLSFANAATWREVANGWRIEGDIESGASGTLTKWSNVAKRFVDAPKWQPFAGPGGWNDFDAVPIGNGTHDGITNNERRTTMTLWSIGCSPLILGSDISNLDSFDKGLITNTEVIAINQAGRIAAPVSQASNSQVWRVQNADGSFTVALFNLGSSTATVTAKWSDLGFSGQATVRDLWTHTDLGTFNNTFPASLATHASRLLQVRSTSLPVALAPQFSPGGGTFPTAQDVGITSGTPSAQIRYTLDGSTPSDTAGTLYAGPVHIGSSATLKAVAFATGMTNSSVTSATYTIGTVTTLSFEAESISFTPSGATASVQTDVNSSGGKWEQLAADTVGDFIDFTLPSVPAGTYQIKMQWKGNNNRGQLSFKVDGTQLGANLDQYSSGQTYPTTTFGTLTFASAGTHVVRLTCTGKNASSGAMNLSADRFVLVSQ